MKRTITVKGMGNVSVKPDLIVIAMKLESQQCDYDKTMELAAESYSPYIEPDDIDVSDTVSFVWEIKRGLIFIKLKIID